MWFCFHSLEGSANEQGLQWREGHEMLTVFLSFEYQSQLSRMMKPCWTDQEQTRNAMSLGCIENLDPPAYFLLIVLIWMKKITNLSDIHLGVEEASWNEESGGKTLREQVSHKHFLLRLVSDRLKILQERVSYYIPFSLLNWNQLAVDHYKSIKPFQTSSKKKSFIESFFL